MGDTYNSVTGTVALPCRSALRVPETDTVSELADGSVIDLVAVERAMSGDPPPSLTPAELRYAALLMVDLGVPIKHTARVLGTHDRYLYRWLKARQNTT